MPSIRRPPRTRPRPRRRTTLFESPDLRPRVRDQEGGPGHTGGGTGQRLARGRQFTAPLVQSSSWWGAPWRSIWFGASGPKAMRWTARWKKRWTSRVHAPHRQSVSPSPTPPSVLRNRFHSRRGPRNRSRWSLIGRLAGTDGPEPPGRDCFNDATCGTDGCATSLLQLVSSVNSLFSRENTGNFCRCDLKSAGAGRIRR